MEFKGFKEFRCSGFWAPLPAASQKKKNIDIFSRGRGDQNDRKGFKRKRGIYPDEPEVLNKSRGVFRGCVGVDVLRYPPARSFLADVAHMNARFPG